jgi:hypothetical protein
MNIIFGIHFSTGVIQVYLVCNIQQGPPWRGKIYQNQPLQQQHTTVSTFYISAETAGLAQHL